MFDCVHSVTVHVEDRESAGLTLPDIKVKPSDTILDIKRRVSSLSIHSSRRRARFSAGDVRTVFIVGTDVCLTVTYEERKLPVLLSIILG